MPFVLICDYMEKSQFLLIYCVNFIILSLRRLVFEVTNVTTLLGIRQSSFERR